MVVIFDFILPFNISTFIVYFINAIIAVIAIIIADEAIAHNVEPKRAFALALMALVVAPLVAPYIGISGLLATIVLPLIVWITFGELILEEDRITKLKVLIVAFVVYYVLSIFVSPYIYGLVGMIIPF